MVRPQYNPREQIVQKWVLLTLMGKDTDSTHSATMSPEVEPIIKQGPESNEGAASTYATTSIPTSIS